MSTIIYQVASKKKTNGSKTPKAEQPKLSEFGLRLKALSDKALKSGVSTLTTRQIHEGIRNIL